MNDPVSFIEPSDLMVGDWPDLPANFDGAKEIAAEVLAKYPKSPNGIGDTTRH